MVYGNGIAVLVGDFCLARGLETVSATGSLVAVESLAAAVTEMAEGEVAQLEGAGDPETTADSYFDVIDRKTGSLMAWCARVGGVLPVPLDAAMARYGRLLGRAFQITDDVLDCAGDETESGKSPGRDLREGKLTLPVLLACQARPDLRDDIRSAMGESGVSMADAARIVQTDVTKKISGQLDFALQQRTFVIIEGREGIGKTEGAEGENFVEVTFQGANSLGNHVSGTAVLSLLDRGGA